MFPALNRDKSAAFALFEGTIDETIMQKIARMDRQILVNPDWK